MKKALLAYVGILALVTAAVVSVTLRAQSSREMGVVNAAAEALGGRDRILALTTLRIEGNGQLASQNGGGNITSAPDAPQKWINIVDHERTIDLVHGRSRVQQRNVTGYAFARLANYGRVRQNQVVDGAVAYNVGPDGRAVRVSNAVVRTRRMEMRANPIVIIRTALASGTRLSNLRTSGDGQTIDLTTQEGDEMTLGVHRETNLPEWVSWIERHENLGDMTYRTSFFGYDKVAGVLLPMGYTTRVDWRDNTVRTLMVDRNSVDVPVEQLAAPPEVRLASAPVEQPTPMATELGKGIWFITGSSHNSIVFEFDDHLTMFEVGRSNAWAKAAIDLTRTLSPKPLTEVIVSHHHFDHTGGFRAAVAEGLTVITHRGNAAILQEIASRPSTFDADLLGRSPRPLNMILVDDQMTLKDDSLEVQLVRVVNNNHMVHAIAAYVPRDRLFVQADMFVADWDFQWWGASYMATLNEYDLQVEYDVPVHGAVMPFSEIEPLIEEQFRNAQALCDEAFRVGFPIAGCPAKL